MLNFNKNRKRKKLYEITTQNCVVIFYYFTIKNFEMIKKTDKLTQNCVKGQNSVLENKKIFLSKEYIEFSELKFQQILNNKNNWHVFCTYVET